MSIGRREMVKLSMKRVNEVNNVSNMKHASMQKMNKMQNKYQERGDEKTYKGREKV